MAGVLATAATIFVIKRLCHGLVTGIGGKLGTNVVTAVIGEDPHFSPKACKEIEKIFQKQLDADREAEKSGEIQGHLNWIFGTYNGMKSRGVCKEELCKELGPVVRNLEIQVLGPLQQSRFAEAILGVFVFGASLHLALLQELACVDPLSDNPEESLYAELLREKALLYADHIERTYSNVVEKRTSLIQQPYIKRTNYLEIVIWKDEHTGEEFRQPTPFKKRDAQTIYAKLSDGLDTVTLKEKSTGKEFDNEMSINPAIKEREDYIKKVVDELNHSLHCPIEVATILRTLSQQPIPKCFTDEANTMLPLPLPEERSAAGGTQPLNAEVLADKLDWTWFEKLSVEWITIQRRVVAFKNRILDKIGL